MFSYTISPILYVTDPLVAQFKDESTGGPTTWHWDFGDGGTSAEQNPSHTYSVAGNYTVTLTITTDSVKYSYSSLMELLCPPWKRFHYYAMSPKLTPGWNTFTLTYREGMNADFSGLEFRHACIDQNGNPFPGVSISTFALTNVINGISCSVGFLWDGPSEFPIFKQKSVNGDIIRVMTDTLTGPNEVYCFWGMDR